MFSPSDLSKVLAGLAAMSLFVYLVPGKTDSPDSSQAESEFMHDVVEAGDQVGEKPRKECASWLIKEFLRGSATQRSRELSTLNETCIGQLMAATGTVSSVRGDSGMRLATLTDEQELTWEFPAEVDVGSDITHTGFVLYIGLNGTISLGTQTAARMIKHGCGNDTEVAGYSRNAQRVCRVSQLEMLQANQYANATTIYRATNRPQRSSRPLSSREVDRRSHCMGVIYALKGKGDLQTAGWIAGEAQKKGYDCSDYRRQLLD